MHRQASPTDGPPLPAQNQTQITACLIIAGVDSNHSLVRTRPLSLKGGLSVERGQAEPRACEPRPLVTTSFTPSCANAAHLLGFFTSLTALSSRTGGRESSVASGALSHK